MNKKKIIKIAMYFFIFMVFFCGSLFFIKNNMTNDSTYDFQEAINLGKSQTIDYHFCGILMRRTYMKVNTEDALLDLTFKDYPIFYIMPFLLATIATIITALLLKYLKKITQKLEL